MCTISTPKTQTTLFIHVFLYQCTIRTVIVAHQPPPSLQMALDTYMFCEFLSFDFSYYDLVNLVDVMCCNVTMTVLSTFWLYIKTMTGSKIVTYNSFRFLNTTTIQVYYYTLAFMQAIHGSIPSLLSFFLCDSHHSCCRTFPNWSKVRMLHCLCCC